MATLSPDGEDQNVSFSVTKPADHCPLLLPGQSLPALTLAALTAVRHSGAAEPLLRAPALATPSTLSGAFKRGLTSALVPTQRPRHAAPGL